jgi:hypothetical protein
MLSLDCDEMIILWPNDLYILFISNQRGPTFVKKVFDYMLRLDCDEMIILWLNDFGLATFFCILLISDQRGPTFVKEVFWFDAYFGLWRNELWDETTVQINIMVFHCQTTQKA